MENIEKIERSTKYLDKSLLVISLVCLIISVVGAVLSVFFRYMLGLSFQVIEEICRYAIIYGVFAYIGPLIKQNQHLKMSILKDLLKGKLKYINNLLISILLFASFVFLFWASTIWIISLLEMGVRTASGTMLMFIPTLSIPIGMFLGSIYSLLQIILDACRLRHHLKEEAEVDTDVRA
ncbi:TRAP transporter small permease [Desertibacillus haloalkaliphilus]|uniref:TRAP transporter small permease n=1 Tax=Desertibacillus haloalkaliphilus TaxID=1328930 RepID=UPI001C265EDE|nr:TRAP transporter small permease subunit [Desertibacillus haloalkaliphilus]MBU8906231.1 TRAP transporter small permease subunit [Desertibacillus haloalkaliphilus]